MKVLIFLKRSISEKSKEKYQMSVTSSLMDAQEGRTFSSELQAVAGALVSAAGMEEKKRKERLDDYAIKYHIP